MLLHQQLLRLQGHYMKIIQLKILPDMKLTKFLQIGQLHVMHQILDIQQVTAEDIDGVILTFITGEVFGKLMHLLFPAIRQTTVADNGCRQRS